MSQMDLEKRNMSSIIGLFGRAFEKFAEGYQTGVEPEVLEFAEISDILKQVAVDLQSSRTERNNVMMSPIDGDKKREIVDTLLKMENDMLKEVIDTLSEMDLEYVFNQTYTDNIKDLGIIKGTLSTLIFGTAEDTVKQNPKEK